MSAVRTMLDWLGDATTLVQLVAAATGRLVDDLDEIAKHRQLGCMASLLPMPGDQRDDYLKGYADGLAKRQVFGEPDPPEDGTPASRAFQLGREVERRAQERHQPERPNLRLVKSEPEPEPHPMEMSDGEMRAYMLGFYDRDKNTPE